MVFTCILNLYLKSLWIPAYTHPENQSKYKCLPKVPTDVGILEHYHSSTARIGTRMLTRPLCSLPVSAPRNNCILIAVAHIITIRSALIYVDYLPIIAPTEASSGRPVVSHVEMKFSAPLFRDSNIWFCYKHGCMELGTMISNYNYNYNIQRRKTTLSGTSLYSVYSLKAWHCGAMIR